MKQKHGQKYPEPETSQEWQEVVDLALAAILLDKAITLDLLEGQRANLQRCYDLLWQGRNQSFFPREKAVIQAIADRIGNRDRAYSYNFARKLFKDLVESATIEQH